MSSAENTRKWDKNSFLIEIIADNSYFVEILDESSGEGWKIKPRNTLKIRQHFAENLNEAYIMTRKVAAEAY